ncbi:Methyl-accepting chemotaxis protein CtpH [compost metagenome]
MDEIRDKNVQIATAAEEQHQVAEEINRHITRIFEDAQQVVECAEKSHHESRQLSNVSGELHALMCRYRA